ncbi:LHFPL tetraspan subfamily member 2a protein [Drosophila ficusphila]|uniref:LHFPL tetraspan subfamily member 2a protein n=1 Tax=Drosophila ficusphila TaxID=30025 RepID=UPI0007E63239|nr:LHFPL tetraspan subfamily member 2a protein [Drosophila ficusphila]
MQHFSQCCDRGLALSGTAAGFNGPIHSVGWCRREMTQWENGSGHGDACAIGRPETECGTKLPNSRLGISENAIEAEFFLRASLFLCFDCSHERISGIDMCYVIITSASLVWFLCTLAADMLFAVALVTPKWLVGRAQEVNIGSSPHRQSSEGIYTRCKTMHEGGFNCGRFDLDGLATDSSIYPGEWKAAMFFVSLGLSLLSVTVLLTLITCCRQSAFGKSIHNMTACAQVVAGICVMLALFLHPMGWGAARVQRLCGPDAEPFYPADCSIGISLYCGVIGVLLTFVSPGISLKAESSNMRYHVRLRVESGSKLVCIP